MRYNLTPFGAAVKKALIDKGMTQVELARQIGISKQYVSDILYGLKRGQEHVPHIVTLLELDPVYLDKTA